MLSYRIIFVDIQNLFIWRSPGSIHISVTYPPSVHPAAKLKTMNRLKLSFDFIYIPPYIYFYKLLFSYIFYVTIIYLIADFLKPIYLVLFSHYLLLYIIICNNIFIKLIFY